MEDTNDFLKWYEGYREVLRIQMSEFVTVFKNKKIPKGFEEHILQQYMAYKNDKQTRNLVIATWVLAVATIILSLLTLTFHK